MTRTVVGCLLVGFLTNALEKGKRGLKLNKEPAVGGETTAEAMFLAASNTFTSVCWSTCNPSSWCTGTTRQGRCSEHVAQKKRNLMKTYGGHHSFLLTSSGNSNKFSFKSVILKAISYSFCYMKDTF